MNPDGKPPEEARPAGPAGGPADRSVNRRSALLGLAAAAGVVVAGGGGLAEASGLLRPQALTPSRFADRFEQVYGRHRGFRRNHAKGLAAAGSFSADGTGSEVSKASAFRSGTVPVRARFSLSGGLPDQPDKADTVRGLALQFTLPHGQQWRTAMVNIPVFPDATPRGFYDRMLASRPVPGTGRADPDAMASFLRRHPETATAMQVIKQAPPSAGFADSTFRGLNAFLATNEAGRTRPIRWSAIPLDTDSAPADPADDYLFRALIERVGRGPVRWKLVLTLAEPADPTHDATIAWPRQRRTLDVGIITIDRVDTEQAGNARDINFDPLVLPDGLAPSDDPLPRARSAVYARSFDRRAREPKSPSAINVEQVPHD